MTAFTFINKFGLIRILVLQAENEQDMNEWISSIRTASQQALNSDNAPRYTQQTPNLRKVLQKKNLISYFNTFFFYFSLQ